MWNKCNKLCILSSSIRSPCQWDGMNTKQTKNQLPIQFIHSFHSSLVYSFSILNLTFCQLLCHTAICGDVLPFCIMYTPTIFRSHKKETSRGSRHYSLLAYSRQACSGSNIIVSFIVPQWGRIIYKFAYVFCIFKLICKIWPDEWATTECYIVHVRNKNIGNW